MAKSTLKPFMNNSINRSELVSRLSRVKNIDQAELRLGLCAEYGLFKHTVPVAYGGANTGFQSLCEDYFYLGRECQDSGLILSLNAHLWGAIMPLLTYGSDRQRQRWLPQLVTGQLVAGHAITEIQSGSDVQAMQTSAITTQEGFRINGHKRYITNAPIAKLMIVYAKLDHQISAFIIEKDDPGIELTDHPAVKGCESATMGDLILNDSLIPANRLLGKPGSGSLLIQNALELERAFIFAGIAGILDCQLQEVIRYSRERKTQSEHLGKNQAISHKIADMKVRLDTVQLWVRECARLKDTGKRITLASSQVKLLASEAFLQSSLDAVQIMGASGLLPDLKFNQWVNDALASRLFSGSSEIQKNIISSLLGTGESYQKT